MTEKNDDFVALDYYRRRSRYGERLTFIFRAYMITGMIAALGGIGFVAYSKLKLSFNQDEKTALAFALLGGATALFSWGYLTYRRILNDQLVDRYAEHQAVGRFLEAWTRFESEARQRAFGKESQESASLREALSTLRKSGSLSVIDLIDAEGLLQFRNFLVHGAQRFSHEEINARLKQLVGIITRIS